MEKNNTIFRIFEKTIEEESYVLKERNKIGVIPMSCNAGAGFTAVNLAKAMVKEKKGKPAFIDFGGNLYYYQLAMDRRFDKREFLHAIERAEKGESLRNIRNWDEGINWCVYNPEYLLRAYKETVTPMESFEIYKARSILQDQVPGDFALSPFPYLGKSLMRYEESLATNGMIWRDWRNLLMEQDILICVIDPKPDRLIAGKPLLEEIKKLDVEKLFIINKDNSGINRAEVVRFIDVPEVITIPQVYRELIYKAEYRCKIPYTVREINIILRKAFDEIMERINFH